MAEKEYGLIADIGGTNARFALACDEIFSDVKVLDCQDYATLEEAAQAYLALPEVAKKAGAIKRACFAVAGAIVGDGVKMTNHVWSISICRAKAALGIDNFELINDFEAIARAIPHLSEDHLTKLGGGEAVPHAPIGVVGPGTGLGMASLFWDGEKYAPAACEGGHVTVPALTRRHFDVFEYLHNKYRHVSAERVCSGKGLVNVYDAICHIDGRDTLPELTAEDISQRAMERSCDVCCETLELMVEFLGTVAGNQALTLGAQGGIYISGGIPAKLGDYFLQSKFREKFEDKGRFREYLGRIPTYMVRHPLIAFVGLQKKLFP